MSRLIAVAILISTLVVASHSEGAPPTCEEENNKMQPWMENTMQPWCKQQIKNCVININNINPIMPKIYQYLTELLNKIESFIDPTKIPLRPEEIAKIVKTVYEKCILNDPYLKKVKNLRTVDQVMSILFAVVTRRSLVLSFLELE